MGAKNKVIAGDYTGKQVMQSFGVITMMTGFVSSIILDKTTVQSYEVIDESNQKSAVSAVGRSLVGGFLLGPAGLLAGVTAKSKGIHIIAVEFKDGKRSLLEIDDKIYKVLMIRLF
jgi:hypothetical protein